MSDGLLRRCRVALGGSGHVGRLRYAVRVVVVVRGGGGKASVPHKGREDIIEDVHVSDKL